jgi:hypothetical protein
LLSLFASNCPASVRSRNLAIRITLQQLSFFLLERHTPPVHSDSYLTIFAVLIGIRCDPEASGPGSRCSKEGLGLAKGEL